MTPSCWIGIIVAPRSITRPSTSESTSSQAVSSSPHGTAMSSSPCGCASTPCSRRSSRSLSRSGMRAAWTSIVPAISDPIYGQNRRESNPDARFWIRAPHVGSDPMAIATGSEHGLFINGEVVEPASGELRDVVEPATGEILGRAGMAGEADVDRAVEAARAALEGPWGKTPPSERSRLLHALGDAIQANRKELAELESRNVGKAISSVKAEVAGAVENFRFFASVLGTIGGRSNPIGGSLLSYTLKEPVGVCGQIVPWNYPLLMSVWKLSPALAAGCPVVLKPDPQTPLSVLRIAELATEVGFPAGAINIVPGDGPTTGSYLVKHPGVDKVAFTGSTRTGGEIMRLCSDPIKRVTLELGGKSPAVVFADANLADAIPSPVWSIYYAAGQSCEARSRVLVEASIYDEFVARAIKAGMVGINMPFTAFPGIPFGGYKQSGFGRELSIDTLELYLETKGVLFSTSPKPFNPFGL